MKNRHIGRCLIALLCAMLALGFLTLSALAETNSVTVQYVKRSWTGTAVKSETKTKTNVPEFPESTSVAAGTYAVNRDITIDGRVSLSGSTEIILMDGFTLNVKGLYIPKGKTLTIYAQSDGTSAGKIISNPSGGTGIGAYKDHPGGEIVIHGGTIEAKGYDHCAGIGSNDGDKTTSPITIYGGTVTAKGGSDGAGIGGGRKCDGGTITIYGGTITAKGGGENGSGIGGGDSGAGGTIEIFGGTITANKDPNEDGAGIGGGDAGNGGNITIHGGTITCWSRDGAGIGGGDDGDGGNITISGGTITCWDEGAANGARIGGGCDADGEIITITGGTIHVYFRDGAGIGGGDSGDGGTITISGGSVYTHPKGEGNGAGIGGGNNAGDGGTITITGGYVNAVSKHGAGIGGGQEDDYIQFPDNSGDGAKLTISGGEVHATSAYAFGIGCGGAWFDDNDIYRVIGPDINGELYGSAGTITISGENTKVYATGVPGGIGGDSGSLTITGGEVHASGRPDYKEGHDGGGHGVFMDGSSSRITIRGGIVYADGYGYGSYPYSGENYVGISTQASAVEITGGTVIANSQYGAGIGGVETDDSKMHGSLLISGPYTVVHASSVRNVGIGCSDWDNKKAKWTFDRYATIEVTSGGDSDKIKKNSVRINEVGAKITAGDSKETAEWLLTVNEKKTAHSTFKFRRIEPCAHDQGHTDENGCLYCGGKEGYRYVTFVPDGDPANTWVDLVPYNGFATRPANPSREGYIFKGWHQEEPGGTLNDLLFDFENTPIALDTTLCAVWTHQHGETTFDPWYSGTSLPGKLPEEPEKYYYLTRDVKLEDGWTWNGGTLDLCLDGHTILGSGSEPALLVTGGTLNIYDEQDDNEQSGFITQDGGKADTVQVVTGGVLNLHGGTISGATNSHSGVAVADEGKFYMAGGAVSGNGRGVTVEDGGTFTISGSVQVTDNAQGNVCLQGENKIQIGGPLSEDSRIGVTADSYGVITSGLPGKGKVSNFFSDDNNDWPIGLNEEGEAIVNAPVTVSFASGDIDAAGAMEDETLAAGSKYFLPPCDYVVSGKIYMGWSVRIGDAEAVRKDPGDPIIVTADTDVTAVWGYTITAGSEGYGTVAADKEIAARGETVTLNVTPDDGYGLSSLFVSSGGTEVPVTETEDHTFTFIMPDGDVTVRAIFAHVHNFSFAEDGDTITATCAYPEICDLEDGKATLKICPPENKNYDRKSAEATIEGEIPGIPTPDIVYDLKTDDGLIPLDSAPVNAGTYRASITVQEHTVATGEFEIYKAPNPAVIVPTAFASVGQEIFLSYYVTRTEGFSVSYEITEALEGCTVENSEEGWKFVPGQKTGVCKVEVTIGGKNNYEGTTGLITVTVTEKVTDTLAIYMDKTSYPYGTEPPVITYDPNSNGEEKLFSYSGKLWDGTSYGPSDAVPTEAGEYTVSIIYEKENYIYYGAQPFGILPASITNAGVTLDPEEFIYDGLEKSVTVSVKIGNKTLTENVDYTVSGTSGTEAGEYTVTVTGRGNCVGEATATFIISKPEFGKATLILPTGTRKIGAHAFEGAFIGKEVIAYVPDGCGSIGEAAFSGCTKLTQIHIPGTCEIQAGAFSGCEKVYIFSEAGNASAKNYCDTHDNCLFVPEPAKQAGK